MRISIDSKPQASQNRTVPVLVGRTEIGKRPMPLMQEIPRPLRDTLPSNRANDAIGLNRKEFDHVSSPFAELVHDLRQPLSTIEALTSYLELVCTDVQTRLHLERIQDMLLQANLILEHASDTDFH
jgi:hypothetical protein